MPESTTTAREFDKAFESLEGIFTFLGEVLPGTSLDEHGHFVLELAVEELFTNMVKYHSNRHGRVAVRITTAPDLVRIDLVDTDTDDFDPTLLPAVDTTLPIRQRKRGGLGLHLVREMADGLEYHYRDRTMTVSVTKRLE